MIKYKLLPSNISELLNRAAHYLGSRNDVAFAYLFGSLAKNRVFPMSDVDIAVYLGYILCDVQDGNTRRPDGNFMY